MNKYKNPPEMCVDIREISSTMTAARISNDVIPRLGTTCTLYALIGSLYYTSTKTIGPVSPTGAKISSNVSLPRVPIWQYYMHQIKRIGDHDNFKQYRENEDRRNPKYIVFKVSYCAHGTNQKFANNSEQQHNLNTPELRSITSSIVCEKYVIIIYQFIPTQGRPGEKNSQQHLSTFRDFCQ